MLVSALLLMGGAPGQGGGNFFMQMLPLLLIIPIFYLFLIRPQQKKQKEHQRMLSELKRGDRVVTSSGIIGSIWGIDEKENKIVLKVGEDTKIEFLRSAIAGKLEP
ncbi:MAG: preprotein translocase subunit YajC [candidate division Zixibacteria bacterium]|nr:preprotein translocase subunit YajC [candidate division Zixibacteria bacterium]